MNYYNIQAFVKKIKMKTFKDLEFKPHTAGMGGVMSRIIFENGYGASVVKTPYTYGGDRGKYELAVLGTDGDLTYDTPITDDVIGYLSETEVTDILEKIQKL
jgi:hypothetical protein